MKVVLFVALLAATLAVARPPLAGDGVWTGDFRYEPNDENGNVGFTRFASFEQHPQVKEWEQLGTSFTVEFWAMWFRPESSEDGSWDLNLSPALNETRFIPLVTRHPGNMLNNEWAHFHVQITRTRKGGVVNAWAGCGCEEDPGIDPVTGEQRGLEGCGLGYLLYSDHPHMEGGEFYFPPEEWHHFAFSFDGDGTEQDDVKTHVAKMYIDGQLRLTNTWNDLDNNPSRHGVCHGRSMQWWRSDLSQIMKQVRVGYLDNQDSPSRTTVDGTPVNEFEVYGFNGALDELRIWRQVRSDRQIMEYYDLSLSGRSVEDSPFLTLYVNFNDGPVNTNKIPSQGTSGIEGDIVSSSNAPLANYLWNVTITADEKWLTMNDKQRIVAKRPETAGESIFTRFKLRGFDGDPQNPTAGVPPVDDGPWEGFVLRVTQFSDNLLAEMNAGRLIMRRYPAGAVIDDDSKQVQLVQHDEQVEFEAFCTDRHCSNFRDSIDNFRDWEIRYVAQQDQLTDAETPQASLFLTIEADCDGTFDACGVCQGHNETCQCVVYHSFRNVRMAYVLLVHMIDFLIEKVEATTEIMAETLDVITSHNFDPSAVANELSEQVEDMMKFYNGCLSDYCSAVSEFNDLLQAFGPQESGGDAKRAELPTDVVETFVTKAAKSIENK